MSIKIIFILKRDVSGYLFLRKMFTQISNCLKYSCKHAKLHGVNKKPSLCIKLKYISIEKLWSFSRWIVM